MENLPKPDVQTVNTFSGKKTRPDPNKLKDPIKNAVKRNKRKTEREHQNWQQPDVPPITKQQGPKE